MSNLNRSMISMNYLSVKVSFDGSTRIEYALLEKNKELGKALANFFPSKFIKLKNQYSVYLKRNGKILRKLSKTEKVSSLKIEESDEIIITDNEYNEYNECLNVKVSFDGNKSEYALLEKNKELGKTLEDYFPSKFIKLKNQYSVYLKRNGKILRKLSKTEKVSSLKIEENDEIIITDNECLNVKVSFDGNKSEYALLEKNKELGKTLEDYFPSNDINVKTEYFLYLKRNGKLSRKLSKSEKVYALEIEENDEIIITDNECLNVKVSFDENKSEYALLEKNKELGKTLEDYFPSNDINVKTEYFLYLKRNGKLLRKLSESGIVSSLEIEDNDEIIISYAELPIDNNKNNRKLILIDNQDIDSRIKVEYSEREEFPKTKKKEDKHKKSGCYNILFWIIISVIILLIMGGLLFFIIAYTIPNEKEKEYKQEELIINKNYPEDYLFGFKSQKIIDLEIEMDNNKSTNMLRFSDFIFIVRKKEIEKDENNLIKKELFTGYIAFLKDSMRNDTKDIISIYDVKLNEYLNGNINFAELEKSRENINSCFAKIEFYLNGEIKNYYLPKGFNENLFIYIEELTQLMIPKISSNLYSKNIDEEMNKSINSYENRLRNLKSKEKNREIYNYKKYTYPNKNLTKKEHYNRNLQETNYTYVNYTGNLNIEEYYTNPSSELFNRTLREANSEEVNEHNIPKNISTLKQYSVKYLGSKELVLDDSIYNTTINSIIDENGILESVVKTTFSSISTSDPENDEFKDMTQTKKEEEIKNSNKIYFNIRNQISEAMIINRTDYLKNESLNKKIYQYFDNFEYKKYLKNESNKNIHKDLYQNEEGKIIQRKLEEVENKYYGIIRQLYKKDLFMNNLLGLLIRFKLINEIDPGKGTVNTYLLSIFGNKNIKIGIPELKTNFDIILERKNQMAYNLLLLLEKSNIDLKERNKNYIRIITDIEKKITDFFIDYDYSGIFQDSLNNLYKQVSNFSEDLFSEFISFVNKVYENYTIIYNNAFNDKYDFIRQIISVTREEYIQLIYNIIDIMKIFENNILIFLGDLEKEIDVLEDFQIDLLYDIKDKINEAKLILKKINKNMFKSIEKSFLYFKNDIYEGVDEILDDILYIIDFLASNINRNEIMQKTINYELRISTTSNLKKIKDIIISIIDMIMLNINKDYNYQMNLTNQNGIKKHAIQKTNEILTNIEEKLKSLISNINPKIDNIEKYELIADNSDIIDDINNKTINDFINNINNILRNFLNIKPEYNDKDSNLTKSQKELLKKSQDITTQINFEINDINEYIYNFTNRSREQYMYNIFYNLNEFKNIFVDEEIKNILNEYLLLFEKIANSKINDIKKIIDKNFNLIHQVLNEQNGKIEDVDNDYKFGDFIVFLFGMHSRKRQFYFCSGFYSRYNQYKKKFNNLIDAIYKEDFVNIFKKYFYKLKNDLLDYINNKISSINKYYFDDNLYKSNFHFIKKINNEIMKIIEILDNYFNENNFTKEIYLKLYNLYDKELHPYNKHKMNDLDAKYKNIYDRTTDPHTTGCSEDVDVRKRECDKWFIFCWKWKWDDNFEIVEHHNNINKVTTTISYSEDDLVRETNIISNKFINKFDKYLDTIVSINQNLYTSLYNETEKKIKNSKINVLLNEYANIFNNIISDNNYLQYLYSQNNQIEEKLNNNLNELEKNINLLNESYYNNYYIMNNSQFIEYPEEILFKINQFQKELIFNSENVIKNTYSLYKNRITNLINSTNLYVLNNLNQNYQYILTNINSSIVIQKYYQIKKDEISSTFHEFINNMYTKNNKLEFENKFKSEDLFLYFQNYSGSLHKIIDESMRFIYYLESKINETFIISFGNCNQTKNSNIADNDTYNNETFDNSTYDENNDANELICSKEKKRIDENYYSKYNYEIVKLRTGIYYTKKLVENLDSLFDYFNINDLMNENKINYYDDLLNDKNIIDLHNETNYKINILKENSDKLLEEPTQNLMSYLKNIYSYDIDYLNISQKIKDLITFKNDDYNNNITYIFDYVFNNSYILLDKFNETLFKQISLRNNYDKYNINETYFEQMYLYYYSLIDDIFQEYKLKIYSLNDNYKFHNIIKKVLENLFVNKTLYYKDIINKSSKKYNLILLEDNFDIGEYQSNFIKNELDNYIFNIKYDYLEIYENNTKYYIDKIINDINEIESKIKDKLKDINDYFISDYKVNITNYIDKNYINELSNNYSNCRNYSYFLSNKDNNELFNNIIDDINNIYGYCFNYNNNYNLKQKINYIINNKSCFNDVFQNENNTYFNETLDFFDCYINDFYNETAFYFDRLDDKYKMELDNVINEFHILILNNEIDENFLMNYSEQYLELEEYKEIDVDKISNYIENIENIIRYANSISNYDINNYLFDKLVASFNESYYNLFNNFILKELIDNITILINNKYEIYLDYIMNKINDEFEYYLLIINQADEIGENSKKAFMDLYERIDEKINATIFDFIEEEVYSYLDNFYKSNNKYLRINFINYYKNKINKYNINLDKFSNYIDEAILNKNFNNTLDSISEEIYNNLVIKTIKNTINESINSKVKILTDKINQFNETIQEIFINKKTRELPDNMLPINNLINSFSEILNNQKIRFNFKISNESLLSLSEFISKELEPPLLLIKDEYNIIEDNLLNKTIGLIRDFPDYYSKIKQGLNLESLIDNITIYYNYTKELLMNYTDVLDQDLQLYIKKLIHFTFIDGLNYTDIPCDEDILCKNYFEEIFSNQLNLSEERRLEEIPEKKMKNIIFKNSKINDIQGTKNKRKLNGYNSKNNSITEKDIDDYILDLKETLLDFNNSYLSKEYKNINNSLIVYLENIRNNYLGKLKKNIDIVGSQFKTILTNEIYKKMEQELFKQYYEIESFIYDGSAQFEKYIKDFMMLLNYSSKLIELNYYLVYWRAKGYFQLFSQLIEKSLQYISDEELKHSNYSNYRQLNEIDNNENIKKLSIFNNKIVNKKDEGLRELDDGFSIGQYGYDSNNSSDEVNDPIIASNNYKNETSSIIDPEFYNEAISDEPPINSVFCFNVMDTRIFNTNFSELEYSIEFKINSRMTAYICINLKALFNKGESLVAIGTDGSANVSFTGECNLYIPSQKVENYIWVKVGLDGVLGGTIGMNLNLYLKGEYKDMYSLDCYNIINSYELRDYVISQVEFGNINSTNFANPYKNETTKETEIYYGIKQYYQINTNEKVEDQCIETTRIYISGTINETITKCE